MTVPFDQRKLSVMQVLEPSGGGSGRHFLDLSVGLKARGHKVTAVYSPLRAEPRFIEELQSLGLDDVHAVAMQRAPGPSDLVAWNAINRIMRSGGPFDLIHAHSSKAGALTRMRLPPAAVPRIYTPHAFRTMDDSLGKAGRLVFGSIESALGRFASDRVICVSADERIHARQLGIPENRLSTVVNGAAPPPNGRRKQMRATLGLPADALVFGFIGRLSPQKAPERLIDAFARIADALPASYLLMIGSGELETELRQRIYAAGLESRVVLRGDIPGPEAVQCFDVLVMPSRYEAMPYVMLEAAAAGKPMILADVGGARTVVDDGDNGLIVPNTDDPSALAAAMNRLACDTARSAFTQSADARRERFSLSAMIDMTEAVYRDVLKERRRSGN